MFDFKVEKVDWYARAWTIKTTHWEIKTPVFMPVGTQATVKWLSADDVIDTRSQIMLSNTYHLHLKPWSDLIAEFGWLHKFMDIDLPILTDSWWFQIFSLWKSWWQSNTQLSKITEDWVNFTSYRDWSKHFFSPERAMQIQEELWADIIMAFDECAPGDSTYEYARAAMNRTHRWAERCVVEHNILQEKREENWNYTQALFPILQWVTYEDLRIESAKFIWELDCPWIAIWWLSVWETTHDMYRILDAIKDYLPVSKPHYLMGVWRPENLLEWVMRWIDMFDCVLATRLWRHWVAFSSYWDLRIPGAKYKLEKEWIPMKSWYETKVSKRYSLWYLRHLMTVKESLWAKLLSEHNIEFLNIIMEKARESILEWKYEDFMKEFLDWYVVKEKK